jgi:TonB-linked SusC/RagA family outer membrane protein
MNKKHFKLPLSMRISLVLLFGVVLQLSAENSYAQRTRVPVSLTNATVEQVLEQIEKTSDYVFLYNDKTIQTNRIVSLKNSSQKISDILGEVFRGTNVAYRIVDNQIILSTKSSETQSMQQSNLITVTGSVKDATGEPLIGVNVKVVGSDAGSVTDIDGNFTLLAAPGATLELSYVGYANQTVKVNGQPLSIVLKEDETVLNEVVVTALGIKREAKSLTYNVQEMKAADLTGVKDASFINSLAGKVAGVTINQSASGIGGSTRVVMRGLKSITNDNNALFVIDGIPVSSMRSNQDKSLYENADGGDSDGMSAINPDDIESMSVLTGAAAAALYGTQGANGVILITTKKGKEGKLSINYSNDTQFLTPFVMPKFQQEYGSGADAFASWGEKKRGTWETKDFFQTGYTETNSISLSSGTERSQTYFSAASTNARGIIPNNTYNRYNFNLRNTTELIKDRLTLDLSASYVITNDNNMMSQGQYHNPLVALYLMPRGEDFAKYQVYERYDSEKYYKTQYWPFGNQGMGIENPYWIANRENMSNHKSRYMFTANLKWKVTSWLNIVGRMRIDNSNDTYERKISASSDKLFASEYGNYMNQQTTYKNTYGDVMAQFNKNWDNWSLNANIGASMDYRRMAAIGYEGNLVTVPNLFTFANIQPNDPQTKSIKDDTFVNNQAVFATLQVGWKSMLYLDLTGRNDWYSSLAFTKYKNKGFFYKSVGLSGVISEMVDLSALKVSFLKVRGSYSEVGNPPATFITAQQYELKNGQVSIAANKPNPNLSPEKTKSWEAGLNLRMFDKLINLDVTYYNSNTYNQFFQNQLEPSSGYSYEWINGGKVNNWGIEAKLGVNANLGKVLWNSSLTFTLNRNKVKELNNSNSDKIEPFDAQGSYKMMITKGGTLGDIYVTGLKTDYQGNIKVNPQTGAIETDPKKWIKAGSTLARYNWGWNNTFDWKGLHIGFLIDWRIGGVGVSATQAKMDYYGTSQATADARDNGGIWVNDTRLNAQDYYKVTGSGMTGALAQYVYSLTNIRLREASIGYTFPTKWFGDAIKGITVSVIGKNLLMFHNKAPFDPEVTASTGTYYQGFDYFMQPSMRSVGFSVKFQY